MHRFRPNTFILLLAGLVGCGTEPSIETIDGLYALSKANGSALPYDTGPIPPRPGTDSTCRILIASGMLSVQNSNNTFEFSYRYTESCTLRNLGDQRTFGTIRQSGRNVQFIVQNGPGTTTTLRGVATANSVTISADYYELVYVKVP